MPVAQDPYPVVELPEPVDRRLRLGPFPSARDALKFLCYAAAGATCGPLVNVGVGLGIAAAGFLAAIRRPDGRAWDEQLFEFLRWRWRTQREGLAVTGTRERLLLRPGFVRLASGDHVAVVRTGGSPVAYLPPAELSRRFEQFRDLLRATDGRLAFLATLVSVRPAPFVPDPGNRTGDDRAARDGYAELVTLLCRRRFVRRVYLVLGTEQTGVEALGRVESQVTSFVERLTALDLHPVRLRDRALWEAARRLGWSGREVAG
jgi:hypothetical protein